MITRWPGDPVGRHLTSTVSSAAFGIAGGLGVYLLIRVRTAALTPSHSAPQVVNIESHGTSSVYPRWMTPAEADVLLMRNFTGGAQATTAEPARPRGWR
jgi:hypothetical protein